jgi:hypothetical protein
MNNRLIQHGHVICAINFVQVFFTLDKGCSKNRTGCGAVVFRAHGGHRVYRVTEGLSGLEQYDRKDDRLE